MENIDLGKPRQENAILGSLENPIIDSNMSREEALRPNPKFEIPAEIFERQAVISVKYLSFDGKYHQGQIIMDKELQKDVEDFFAFLLEQKFKVKKVVPVAHKDYDFDDDKSMRDNNTSGFNPRFKVGLIAGSTELSEHARGWAFDLNPIENPYFGGPGRIPVTPFNPDDKDGIRDKSEYVDPEENDESGDTFEYYNIDKEGTVTPWVADFLKKRGWTWGMDWYKDEENPRVDTQHFEKKLNSPK
jgi:hypothetical protein